MMRFQLWEISLTRVKLENHITYSATLAESRDEGEFGRKWT